MANEAASAAEPLLKVDEVAGQLKMSRSTVWRRVADGTLPPPLKFGGSARWEPADIRAARNAAGDRRKGR